MHRPAKSKKFMQTGGNASFKKGIASIVLVVIVICVIAGGVGLFYIVKNNKRVIAIKSLSAIGKVSKLLPIQSDTKKELEVVNSLVSEFTKQDGKERAFMIMLQNDMELRPGGGFLGQYAIVKVKDGQVTSTFVEDANLLDYGESCGAISFSKNDEHKELEIP